MIFTALFFNNLSADKNIMWIILKWKSLLLSLPELHCHFIHSQQEKSQPLTLNKSSPGILSARPLNLIVEWGFHFGFTCWNLYTVPSLLGGTLSSWLVIYCCRPREHSCVKIFRRVWFYCPVPVLCQCLPPWSSFTIFNMQYIK